MTAKEFVAKAAKDNDLLKRMKAAKSRDEIFAIAQKEGVKSSKSEFVAEMEKIKASAAKLSDKDLENVAGGGSTTETISMITEIVSKVTPAAAAFI